MHNRMSNFPGFGNSHQILNVPLFLFDALQILYRLLDRTAVVEEERALAVFLLEAAALRMLAAVVEDAVEVL